MSKTERKNSTLHYKYVHFIWSFQPKQYWCLDIQRSKGHKRAPKGTGPLDQQGAKLERITEGNVISNGR